MLAQSVTVDCRSDKDMSAAGPPLQAFVLALCHILAQQASNATRLNGEWVPTCCCRHSANLQPLSEQRMDCRTKNAEQCKWKHYNGVTKTRTTCKHFRKKQDSSVRTDVNKNRQKRGQKLWRFNSKSIVKSFPHKSLGRVKNIFKKIVENR